MSQLRVAHVSDTHLGYRAYRDVDPHYRRNQRAVDFERAWEEAVSQILEAEPDLVIHSGDVFHYPRPDWKAIQVFIRGMKRLTQAGLPVVVIGGNHDTPRLRTNGSVFSVCEAAVPEAHWACGYEEVTVRLPWGPEGIVVHCVPYGYLHGRAEVHSPIETGEWNLMTVHGTVIGQLTPSKFSHGEEDADYLVLEKDFDYVALGHHHLHYRARGVSYYAGSTERCGFSDEASTPGWALVTLEKGMAPGVVHYAVASRPMLTTASITCEGSDPGTVDQVADWIVSQVVAHDMPNGLFRSELLHAERGMVRRVQRAVDRKLDRAVWKVIVYAKSEVSFGDFERTASSTSENLSILELFEEYLKGRDYSEAPEGFAERFRERGRVSIETAMYTENERMEVS